ncbi:ApbE family lipoprotein [Thermocrinis albus DSM 14484]|uniref:FAD:protein FMN transferase n=1 Tax=Thermocrinis albus (strain DSM 14484 / JCM 11386 / HI 11/12) TaxID=638303 RepID=D3SP18_THEAH|nr:FAD:protein FMN transferase [Thermocrinis albus]ADC88905.1 ApbE family lipoprotein [Thermocrinis albus DSM 14484]
MILLLLLFLSSAFAELHVFHLMGTYAFVELPEGKAYEAYRYMKSLEEKLSDYIESSEVSAINREAGKNYVRVSEETLEVIEKALEVSRKTYGVFDITAGALTIRSWRLKEISEEEAKKLINYKDVVVKGRDVLLRKKGMAIDLGGIGKGFAVQKAYQHLKTAWGFIAIAGDMKVWGHSRLLAVEDPIKGGVLLEGYNKKDLCLSTSSNKDRRHIWGTETYVVQVTVAYDDCTFADAFATALYAMTDQQRERFLRENPHVGVLILYQDGSLYMNSSFRRYFQDLRLYNY